MESFHRSNNWNLLTTWSVIWRHKITVVITVSIFTGVATIMGFILPESFQSTTTFLPVSNSGNDFSQYRELASMAGVAISNGAGSDVKKINAVLSSRNLRERIVDRLDLVKEFKLELDNSDLRLRAVERLEKMVKVTNGKNEEIELAVEASSPELAQRIATQYILELEGALNESNFILAKKDRELNERQLIEQSLKLKAAQENLAVFQNKYRILDANTQVKRFTELLSNLYEQKVQLEVQFKQLSSLYNPEDIKITSLTTQILSIERQITEIQNSTSNLGGIGFSDAPEQLIEYQNLLRELEITTKIYTGLMGNFAQSTLTTNTKKVFVEVIDVPLLPDRRFFPNRTIILVLGIILGLIVSITSVLAYEWILTIIYNESPRV